MWFGGLKPAKASSAAYPRKDSECQVAPSRLRESCQHNELVLANLKE